MRLRSAGKGVLAALVLMVWAASAWAGSPGYQGRIAKALDGDSLIVVVGGRRIEVRLQGIDCPEWGQPWGQEAKRFTAGFVGKPVRLLPRDVDRRGRLVARVILPGGKDLGLLLLARGLAWWYARYAIDDRAYARAWWGAVRQGRGLWGDDSPQVPPWDWRRTHHRRRR